MKPNTELDRRKVLGTVGGLAIAGSGLAALSGSATATVKTGLNTSNTNLLTNDDGSVRKVLLDASGDYAWDGLDSPATSATVAVKAKVPGDTYQKEVTSEQRNANGTHGKGSFSFEDLDLTETFSDEVFEDGTDDDEKKVTTVQLWVEVTIAYGNGKSVGDTAANDMSVRVKNQPSSAAVEAESDANVSSYDQKFLSHDGENELLITHGANAYTFFLDVSDWKDPSASGFNDDVDNWNLAINLDDDGNDYADFQVSRKPDGSVQVTPATDNGWNTGSAPSSIDASATDDGTLTVEIAASEFGDTYSVMGQATAGGEYPATHVSNTEGKGFNADGGFDASDEYYLTVSP
ncbi:MULTISPECIES: hypothetical protein [Halorussus]|uniref:hypothetical protein n=1 Tax=Halorussus TaxID=1070314 RepID=UPI0020A1E046|nr:hypothetical protein [Halorussus vallis]USZ75325.1 hypothetical protein NGM07_18065 [Halorussus vallis]